MHTAIPSPEAPLAATSGRRSVLLAALAIILATSAAYVTSFRGALVFDDIPGIANNPTIRDPRLDLLLVAIGPQGGTLSGRPVPNLTLALNHAISGTELWSYHAVNLLIHLLAGLTLFGLVRRTLRRRPKEALAGAGNAVGRSLATDDRPRAGFLHYDATPIALAVALLWSLHPLQTESVTYLVQRVESLMGLCYLLTLYCFIRGVASAEPRLDPDIGGGNGGAQTGCAPLQGRDSAGQQSAPTAERVRPEAGSRCSTNLWFTFSIIACLVGMGCKEVMVSAPFIVFLYDRAFVAGSFREAWQRRRWFYIALMSTWLLLGVLLVATENRAGTAGLGTAVAWWEYSFTQCRAIVHYLRLSLWPQPLVFDYGTAVVRSLASVAPQAGLLGLLLGGTAWALVRKPALGFLGAWFFLILAPSSSVVPVATQTMAEHRMYLPLAAVIVLVVFALHRVLGRAAIPVWLGAALALGGATARRNLDYHSPMGLWADAARKIPANGRAHNNTGAYLLSAGRIDEARQRFATALRLNPQHASAHYNLGNLLAKTGQNAEAIAAYETALRFDPKLADAHVNLGNVLDQLGRPAEAVPHYEEALRLDPNAADVHAFLGAALLRLGRVAAAIANLQAALDLEPARAETWGELAGARLKQGDLAAARRAAEQALRLKPDLPGPLYTLGNIDVASGNFDAAIARYRQALELAPDHLPARNNLANALLVTGRIEEAITHYRQILKQQPDDQLVRENLARALELQR